MEWHIKPKVGNRRIPFRRERTELSSIEEKQTIVLLCEKNIIEIDLVQSTLIISI